MTSRDHARALVGKARDDELAVRKLADDAAIADPVVYSSAHAAATDNRVHTKRRKR